MCFVVVVVVFLTNLGQFCLEPKHLNYFKILTIYLLINFFTFSFNKNFVINFLGLKTNVFYNYKTTFVPAKFI